MQEALTLHSSRPLAVDAMAGLAVAADTIAAVAAAGARPDQKAYFLTIDAYERPVLECLQVLCKQVCSAARACGAAKVEATACCLCSVLRMCAELRYPLDDTVSCTTMWLCCPSAPCIPSLAIPHFQATNLQHTSARTL